MKKILSIITALSILISCMPMAGITSIAAEANKGSYPKFKDNRIIIELEDLNYSTDIFEIYNNENAGGGKTLHCIKKKNLTDKTKIEAPAITYEFYAPENKKYYFWMRVLVENNSGDSIWVGVDDGDYIQKTFSIEEGNFRWQMLSAENLTEGVHTLKLFPRESYNELDKLLISDSIILLPEGSGEAASNEKKELIYPLPTIKPAKGHPRLWFTKDNIPQIIKNMSSEEHQPALAEHQKMLAKQHTGELIAGLSNNFNNSVLDIIKSNAFEYAIYGKEENGKKAISMLKNFLNTLEMPTASTYNSAGKIVYAIATVYDWCYPLLTKEELVELKGMAIYFATMYLETRWPPTNQIGWGGHGSEEQMVRDLLALGIATYDEDPYIYNTVAGRLESEYKPIRQFYYPSGKVPYGSDYFNYRFNGDVAAFAMIANTTGKNFWGSDDIAKVPYYLMYITKPDEFPLAEGDFSIYNINSMKNYSSQKTNDYVYSMLGSWYKDGYLKGAFYETKETLVPSRYLEFLIFNDPEVKAISKENLPLTRYFGYPFSTYIARTGWDMGKDSPDVVVSMNMREFTMQDHMHQDAGEFEIYYKGNLATDSGYYQAVRSGEQSSMWGVDYWENYYHQTVAHNCMLIYDPNEPTANFSRGSRAFEIVNGGGQFDSAKTTYNFKDKTVADLEANPDVNSVKVLGHEAGLDPVEPNYTYIKGDLGGAYSEKVDGYERSFMFLNLKNKDVPAALIVFDRVETMDPTLKKTYLLHGINAPEINGTRTILKRTERGYNGKLVNDTLLPKADDLEIKQVGESPNDYWVGGKLYNTTPADNSIAEGGGIRTEISPKSFANEHYFLNVMQMSDADSEKEPLEATMIEAETHTGVKIADRVVMFGKEKLRVSSDVEFAFDGEGEYEVTVADLKEGTWAISENGTKIASSVATKDGGVAVFKLKGGKYKLTYESENSVREEIKTTVTFKENAIKIRMNDNYLYTEEDPVMINDRVLLPLRAIFDALGVTVTWDDATRTAIAQKGQRIVTVTEDSNIATVAGKEVTIDVPATIIGQRMFVPVRFIAEAFLTKVNWNNVSQTVIITGQASSAIPGEGGIKAIDAKWDSGLITTESNGYNTIDGDVTTYWATGANEPGTRWISYELSENTEIKKIEVLWGSPHQRTFKYDVLVSDDGVNWKMLIENGESALATEETRYDYQTITLPEGTKGKYVKLNCHGNSKTFANNIVEILFK